MLRPRVTNEIEKEIEGNPERIRTVHTQELEELLLHGSTPDVQKKASKEIQRRKRRYQREPGITIPKGA